MKTLICLIRHGQTDGNKMRIFQGRTDLKLNETGIEQAHTTADLLKKIPLKWNYLGTSPLKRAQETANIIKDDLNLSLDVNILNDAIERSFGVAEGIPISEENYQRILRNEFAFEESEQEIILRAEKLIENILSCHRGENILIVSHSHFIKAVFKPYIKNLQFNDSIRNTSLNFLIFDDDNVLTSINLTSYDEAITAIKKE